MFAENLSDNEYHGLNYALSQFLWFDRLTNQRKICANASKHIRLSIYM